MRNRGQKFANLFSKTTSCTEARDRCGLAFGNRQICFSCQTTGCAREVEWGRGPPTTVLTEAIDRCGFAVGNSQLHVFLKQSLARRPDIGAI